MSGKFKITLKLPGKSAANTFDTPQVDCQIQKPPNQKRKQSNALNPSTSEARVKRRKPERSKQAYNDDGAKNLKLKFNLKASNAQGIDQGRQGSREQGGYAELGLREGGRGVVSRGKKGRGKGGKRRVSRDEDTYSEDEEEEEETISYGRDQYLENGRQPGAPWSRRLSMSIDSQDNSVSQQNGDSIGFGVENNRDIFSKKGKPVARFGDDVEMYVPGKSQATLHVYKSQAKSGGVGNSRAGKLPKNSTSNENEFDDDIDIPQDDMFQGFQIIGAPEVKNKQINSKPVGPPPIKQLSNKRGGKKGFSLRSDMEKIVDKISKRDEFGIFLDPVTEEMAPGYFSIIKTPMCVATIKDKLAQDAYKSWDELEEDVILMYNNAMTYNQPDTVFYKQARRLLDISKKYIQFGRDGRTNFRGATAYITRQYNAQEAAAVHKEHQARKTHDRRQKAEARAAKVSKRAKEFGLRLDGDGYSLPADLRSVLSPEENRRRHYKPKSTALRGGRIAIADWGGLVNGCNGDGVPWAPGPCRTAQTSLIIPLPFDAYVRSIARFAQNLKGAARKTILQRASLCVPVQGKLPNPTSPLLTPTAIIQKQIQAAQSFAQHNRLQTHINNASLHINGAAQIARDGQPPIRVISPTVNSQLNPKCANGNPGGVVGYPHVPTSLQPTNLQLMSGWPVPPQQKQPENKDDEPILTQQQSVEEMRMQTQQEQNAVDIQVPKKQDNVVIKQEIKTEEVTESMHGTESGLTSMQQDDVDGDEDLDMVTVDSDDLEEFDEDEFGMEDDQGDGFEDVQEYEQYEEYEDDEVEEQDGYDYGQQYNAGFYNQGQYQDDEYEDDVDVEGDDEFEAQRNSGWQ